MPAPRRCSSSVFVSPFVGCVGFLGLRKESHRHRHSQLVLPENGHMEVNYGCMRNDKEIKADMKLKVEDHNTNAVFDVAP